MTKNVKVTLEIPGQEPVVYEGYDMEASEGMQYEPELTTESKGPYKPKGHDVEIRLRKELKLSDAVMIPKAYLSLRTL